MTLLKKIIREREKYFQEFLKRALNQGKWAFSFLMNFMLTTNSFHLQRKLLLSEPQFLIAAHGKRETR